MGFGRNILCRFFYVKKLSHLLLQENVDIYSTNEPQGAFHQRVSFCLDLYNQSVRVCKISYGYHNVTFKIKILFSIQL